MVRVNAFLLKHPGAFVPSAGRQYVEICLTAHLLLYWVASAGEVGVAAIINRRASLPQPAAAHGAATFQVWSNDSPIRQRDRVDHAYFPAPADGIAVFC